MRRQVLYSDSLAQLADPLVDGPLAHCLVSEPPPFDALAQQPAAGWAVLHQIGDGRAQRVGAELVSLLGADLRAVEGELPLGQVDRVRGKRCDLAAAESM